MELSRGRGVLVSWQLWSLAIWSHSSLAESAALCPAVHCECWIERLKLEFFHVVGSVPNSVWVMYSPTLYQCWGQSWSFSLGSCKNTEEMGYIWGLGAGGGLGRWPENNVLMWIKMCVRVPLCDSEYCVGLKLVWSVFLRCSVADSFCGCTTRIATNIN